MRSVGSGRGPTHAADDPAHAEPRTSRVGGAGWVVLGMAAVIGGAARAQMGSPLWLDEALSARIASQPLGELVEALRHDGHPPLYYAVLHGWMSIFGEGDAAVRSFSLACALATLPLRFVAARRFIGTLGPWAVAIVVLPSGYAIRYATEARMYALVMLGVTAGLLLIDDARREPSVTRLAGIAAIAGALLWTHYWAMWLGAAVVVSLVISAARTPENRRAAVRIVCALGVGAASFVPWLPVLLEQAAHTGTPWSKPARPGVMVTQTVQDFGGGYVLDAVAVGVLLSILYAIGALGVSEERDAIRLGLRPPPVVMGLVAVSGATLCIGGLVGVVTSTAYEARYASTIFPLVAIVIARGLALVPGESRRAVVAGLLVVASGGVAWVNQIEDRTQAREVADALAAHADAADIVVVCPDQLGPDLFREVDAALPVLRYPDLEPADIVDWRDYAERHRAADPFAVAEEADRLAGDGDVWVAYATGYRGFGRQCEDFLASLAARRAPAEVHVLGDENVYEPSSLLQFAPKASA